MSDTEDRPAATLRELPSWLLNQVAMRAHRAVADGLAPLDARKPHYAMLAALAEFGPSSQAALGRRCCLDRSDVVAVVNELSEPGYVERAPDPKDRRRNVITITRSGRRRLRELDVTLASLNDELLAPLSAPEREQLTRLLTRVLDGRS